MEDHFAGPRNSYVLSPNTSRLLRENAELREEVEALKRTLDLRLSQSEIPSVSDLGRASESDAAEEQDTKKHYEEAKRLNDYLKDQVDFLTQQLNIIVTVAPPDGEDADRWTDDETKLLTIVRGNMNTPKEQESLQKLHGTVQSLRNQMNRAKKKMALMMEGLEKKDDENESLSSTVANLTAANLKLKDEVSSLKKRLNTENSSMDTLRREYSNKKALIQENEKELQKGESTIQELKDEVSSLKNEIDQLNRRNKKLNNEMKDLKMKRSSTVSSVTSEELKLSKKRLEDLEKQNKQLKKDLKSEKAAKVKEEKKAASDVERLMKEVASLRNVIENMRQGNLPVPANLQELGNSNKKLQQRLAKEQDLNKSLKESLRNQVEASEDQQRQLASEIQQKVELQSALIDAKKKMAELKKGSENKSQELDAAKRHTSEMAVEFESMIDIAGEKQQLINVLSSDREKAEKYNKFLQAEIERFKLKQADVVSANLTELREENVSLREDIAKIKKEHQQEMKKLKSKKPQAGVFNELNSEQLQEAINRYKASEKIIKRLEKERMNLNEKVQGLYKQINALRKRHDDEINELKEQLAASSTGTRDLNDELRRAGQKLDRNKSDVYGTGEFPTPPDDVILEETRLLQSKISDLQEELAKCNEEKTKTESELNECRKALLLQNEKLVNKSELLRKETEAKNKAKKVLADIKSKLDELAISEKKLKEKLKITKENASDMEERLILEMNSMEKENNKLHQNINRLKQEKQKLKTDLPEEDLKKLRSKEPPIDKKPDERKLAKENKELKKEIEKLQGEAEQTHLEMQQLQNTVKNKQHSLEKLKKATQNNDVKIKTLQSGIFSYQETKNNLESKMTHLKRADKKLREENRNLKLEKEELTRQQQLTSRLLEKLDKNRSSETRKEDSNEEVKRKLLEEEIKNLEDAGLQLQRELEETKQDFSLKNEELEKLHELEFAQLQIVDLQMKLEETEKQLKNAHDQLSATLEEKQAQVSSLTDDLKEARNKILKLEDKINRIKAGADDITKSFATAENDKQANEVQNLVKLLAEAQQENRNKSEELRRLVKVNKILSDNVRELRSDESEPSDVITQLSKTLHDELDAQRFNGPSVKSKAPGPNPSKNAEKKSNQASFSEKPEESNKVLKKQNLFLTKDNESLRNQIQDYNLTIENQNKRIDDFRRKMEEKKNDVNNMEDLLKRKDKQISSLHMVIDSLRKKNNEAKKLPESVPSATGKQDLLLNLPHSESPRTKSLDSARSGAESHGDHENIQNLEDRIAALEKFHKSDEATLKLKRQNLKDQLQELQHENQRLQESNFNLISELQNYRIQFSKLEAEKLRSQTRIEELEKDENSKQEMDDKEPLNTVFKNRIHKLEDELETTRIKLDAAQQNVKILQNLRDLLMKNKDNKLLEAEEKLTECERQLSQLQTRYQSSKISNDERFKHMKEKIKNQQQKISKLDEIAKDLSGEVSSTDTKTYFLCRLSNVALEYENMRLKHEFDFLKKKLSLSKEDKHDYLQNCPFCDQMRKQLSDFESEIDRLRKELSHFDEYFFNEVEDLRHNYAEAVKLNVLYEDQLKELSARHGVPVFVGMDEVDCGEKGEEKQNERKNEITDANNEIEQL